jgi:glutamyl-tRNA reductase
VRSETGVSRGAANVSSVAVELARRVFGDLEGKVILVIGAGKMSALAARHLRVAGARSILVTNRSPDKAAQLAAEVEGTARPWNELPQLLAEADVVLSSTGATEPILRPRLVKDAMKARRWRPLVIVDIAVPRDADPAIGRFDGVYLFDIDDLERVVAENLKERQKEAEAAMSIVEIEVIELRRWLRAQRVVPTIRSLRERFHQIAMAEAERCIGGLGGQAGDAEVQKAIRRMSELIANKLLHTPLSALKASEHTDVDTMVEVTQRLFALSESGTAPAMAPAVPAPAAAIADGAGLVKTQGKKA